MAAHLEDGLFVRQDEVEFTEVLAPKIAGILNLHAATKKYDIKQIICFSSLSGIVGLAGQTTYSAANAYLDAFVEQQNSVAANYTKWTSLAFGLWDAADVIMKADKGDLGLLDPKAAI